GLTRKGDANNSVLRDYYFEKCKSKLKLVALGAVMHKVCNIIFAVLRDQKEFVITSPAQHRLNYLVATSPAA
ncbi:MAG: IS110 family transposase, partial [Oscillospiraceae bacterium]